jgi:hypothetical protein
LSIPDIPISNTTHPWTNSERSEPLGHILGQDKFQHQRGHTMVSDTAILLPPMGKGGSDWSTDIVEPFTWFNIYTHI